MNEFIHIEPAHEQRPAFALWGLSQEKPLQTATASGWDVPVDLYPSVPAELLTGAYVDGYPYGVSQAQPTFTTADTLTQDPDAPERPVLVAEAPKPRKRTAKKAAAVESTSDDATDTTDSGGGGGE